MARSRGVDECDCSERATRIELALSAWEAEVLPLNYARVVRSLYRSRPGADVTEASPAGPARDRVSGVLDLVDEGQRVVLEIGGVHRRTDLRHPTGERPAELDLEVDRQRASRAGNGDVGLRRPVLGRRHMHTGVPFEVDPLAVEIRHR